MVFLMHFYFNHGATSTSYHILFLGRQACNTIIPYIHVLEAYKSYVCTLSHEPCSCQGAHEIATLSWKCP